MSGVTYDYMEEYIRGLIPESTGKLKELEDFAKENGVPIAQKETIKFLEFMVNIRHVFYGLSLIEKFRDMGKKKLYMIFSLTDETYSLFFITKVPEGVDEHKFLFSIALLDQLYWIIGSAIGAIAGTLIPFDTTGIDFAMTALFVVIFVEQWLTSRNHLPALTGIAASLICLLIFGSDNFILPSMICIMIILLSGRKVMEEKEVAENAD